MRRSALGHRRLGTAIATAVAAAALSACGSGDSEPDMAVGSRDAAGGRAGHARPDSRPGRPDPAPLRLDGGGLGDDLKFGAPRRAVVARLSRELGAPTGSDHVGECGEGPIDFVRFGGLSLAFQQDRLVGWYARSPFRKRAVAGIAIGDPRTALGSAMIEETTLGEEFRTADGIHGLLGGDTVEALWAGSVCAFR